MLGSVGVPTGKAVVASWRTFATQLIPTAFIGVHVVTSGSTDEFSPSALAHAADGPRKHTATFTEPGSV
jgi:hypothetical protein